MDCDDGGSPYTSETVRDGMRAPVVCTSGRSNFPHAGSPNTWVAVFSSKKARCQGGSGRKH